MNSYECDGCGEAENCDLFCAAKTECGEPKFCLISGDDCEWSSVKEKVVNKISADKMEQLRKSISPVVQVCVAEISVLQAEVNTFAAWRKQLEDQAKRDNSVVKFEKARAERFQTEIEQLKGKISTAVNELSYIESILDCGSPAKARERVISLMETLEKTD